MGFGGSEAQVLIADRCDVSMTIQCRSKTRLLRSKAELILGYSVGMYSALSAKVYGSDQEGDQRGPWERQWTSGKSATRPT